MRNLQTKQTWWGSGDPWIWLTSAAVSISIIVVFALLLLIASRGLWHFLPHPVMQAQYDDHVNPAHKIIGEIHGEETVPAIRLQDKNLQGEFIERNLIKIGNRELNPLDFRWVVAQYLSNVEYPADILVLERRKGGNAYGYLRTIKEKGQVVAQNDTAKTELVKRLQRAHALFDEIEHLEKTEVGNINHQLEQLRLEQRSLELHRNRTGEPIPPERLAVIQAKRAESDAQFQQLSQRLAALYQEIDRDSLTLEVMDGQEEEVKLSNVIHQYYPNTYTTLQSIGHFFAKIWEFVSENPREANTEGGVFPAIFGTIILVFIMTLIVTPFGVIAAVYLREYAKQGFLTRSIRIAVNNLAGVPSIVYGVFGLGFFVYFIGGSIDQLFFEAALPSPTFGSGGMLWASLTLAILTLPVVIVSTEEGLARIPKAIREGSLALGATKAETLWRTVLPMASPAIMTGMILAIARAAGEVAPLMLVGVVKLAPSLVLDGNYPFMHLERKFMHLGFHIHDVAFQSPNVEAVRPLAYATSFLLITIIIVLNLAAFWIRNRLREKYKALETT